MSSGVNMLCFTASFGVALALEVMGLWARPRWRRLAVVAAAFAGIVAQTWYLAERAASSPWAPLSSQHDWYLAAAWGLAIVYLALVLYQPKASIGLFLLPVVLALIGAARFASTEPMAGAEMPRIWGILHGVFLMLGTVAVLLGFVAGMMYLVQSARLKNKAPLNDRFRLPSLEWLERVNARSLIAATILVGLGFVTGVLMRLALRDGSGLQWTDPVVISLSGMFSWLVAAEAFRLAYPAARRGRKVAYLTLAGFVFLVITLSTFMSSKSMHGRGGENSAPERQTIEQSLVPLPLEGRAREGGEVGTGAVYHPDHPSPNPSPSRGRERRLITMNLRMIGCTHRASGVDLRQQLAFGSEQTSDALTRWRERFPTAEFALLSTCNRVELYAAGLSPFKAPETEELVDALLGYHGVPTKRVEGQILSLNQREAVAHLYRVAASLDSMVVGEPQILAQVKQAYQRSVDSGAAGPALHDLFQSALRAARRVYNETGLHKLRVSIPSVAIADFASRVFEQFDDKHVLVIGAGEMAEETIRYLQDAGATRIHVVNRSPERALELAAEWNGVAVPWERLWDELAEADLVIGATGATEPIVTASRFERVVAPLRQQRPLFILDLAVPRNFEPAVGEQLGVYLYSLDDLALACERNRDARAAELPAAEQIIVAETDAFMAAAHRHITGPVISGLRRNLEEPKVAELERLFKKLPDLDERSRAEIVQFADRLVNKLLHPPLESLRDAAQEGPPHGLLDALRRLFRLEE